LFELSKLLSKNFPKTFQTFQNWKDALETTSDKGSRMGATFQTTFQTGKNSGKFSRRGGARGGQGGVQCGKRMFGKKFGKLILFKFLILKLSFFPFSLSLAGCGVQNESAKFY
jgi:hypothetical protein